MEEKIILLVEDNPDDVELTLRAFRKNSIGNKVIVAKDGVEALDYLFGTGVHAGRNVKELPVLILLDLKLPRIDGMEVLKRIRQNDLTRLLPVGHSDFIGGGTGQNQRVQAGLQQLCS